MNSNWKRKETEIISAFHNRKALRIRKAFDTLGNQTIKSCMSCQLAQFPDSIGENDLKDSDGKSSEIFICEIDQATIDVSSRNVTILDSKKEASIKKEPVKRLHDLNIEHANHQCFRVAHLLSNLSSSVSDKYDFSELDFTLPTDISIEDIK